MHVGSDVPPPIGKHLPMNQDEATIPQSLSNQMQHIHEYIHMHR